MIPIASCLKEAVLEVVLFSFLTHHKVLVPCDKFVNHPFQHATSSLKFLLYLKALFIIIYRYL